MWIRIINYFKRKSDERTIFNLFVNSRCKTGAGKIIFHKGSRLQTKSGGRFVLSNGYISLGEKHWPIDERKTMICIGENGKIECNGDVYIYAGNHITIADNSVLKIGAGSYINVESEIDCFQQITIGKGTVISSHVVIRDSDNHVMDGKIGEVTKPISIGNHVWIGMNVIILKGVNIGDGAVIGAGSIVTKDIPPRCCAAGNPYRVIRTNVKWDL